MFCTSSDGENCLVDSVLCRQELSSLDAVKHRPPCRWRRQCLVWITHLQLTWCYFYRLLQPNEDFLGNPLKPMPFPLLIVIPLQLFIFKRISQSYEKFESVVILFRCEPIINILWCMHSHSMCIVLPGYLTVGFDITVLHPASPKKGPSLLCL